MEQLVMRWRADDATMPDEPDWGEFVCRTYSGADEDKEKWALIIKESFGGDDWTKESFDGCMNDHGKLENDMMFIIEKDGDPAATLAVIPHWDVKEGYIHMVGCRPKYQGVGLGTRLNAAAVRCLLENGLETAYLTTDDFRIPAIRSYLRAGFYPDIKDDSHRERWDKIYEIIGK